MARISQPDAIKRMKGTATVNSKTGETVYRDSGKRPIKPTVQGNGAPQAPKSLSKPEKAVWLRLINAMPEGVYTVLDEALMANYVRTVVLLDNVALQMSVQDVQVLNLKTGKYEKNPLLAVHSDLNRLLVTMGARLGLDPVARSNLSMEKTDKPTDENPFGIH